MSATATMEKRPVEQTAPPRARRWWTAEWTLYAAAGVLASLVTFVSLRLWHLKLTVPMLYSGDALPMAAHVKTVLKEGWFQYEPNLGAPTGEWYFDFPQADNFHLIGIKLIGWAVPDWAAAMNLYYLIGFPLAAITAVWFLRVVGVSRLLAVALSVVYAIAPYHFVRAESHLYLASYYPVPLALVVLMWVFRGEPLWTRRPGVPKWWGILSGRGAAVVLITALLGTASQYYSLFFLILLAFAGIVTLIRRKDWRRFWGAAAAGAITVVVLILNVLPGTIYGIVHGPSINTLERNASESEVYGFKLAQLLLPWSSHIIPQLRNFRAHYDATYPLLSENPALGAIAAAGLVASFAIILYVVVGWRSLAAKDWTRARWFQTLTELSSLLLVAFLFGTVGGFSTFISFVTSSIRGWNRIAIVMAILCLAVVGLLVDRVIRAFAARIVRGRERRTGAVRAVLAAIVAAGLVLVAVVDQSPWNASASLLTAQADFAADDSYFTQVQEQVPHNGMVLQLPYIGFPEDASPNGTLSSDELRPFLHTDNVRWTAAGIKGRPAADWPEQLEQYPVEQMVTLAAAADMSGILIDGDAYTDKGAVLLKQLQATLGEAPLTSPGNYRWHYFDLAGERAALQKTFTTEELASVGRTVTNPTMPYLAPDFGTTVNAEGEAAGTSNRPSPQLTVENPTRSTVPGTFSVAVSNGTANGTATVQGPGVDATVPVSAHADARNEALISEHVSVTPGRSYYTVTSQIAGTPVPGLLSDLRFVPDDVQAFLDRVPAASPRP